MKACKRIVCHVLGLLVAMTMMLYAPIEVAATTAEESSASIVMCASIDADGEIVTMVPGIPVVTQNYQVMYAGEGLYTSDELVYFAALGEEGAVLEYAGTSGGVDVYAFTDVAENLCFDIKVPMIGQKAFLIGMNRDAEMISYEVEITDGSTRENKEGMYDLEIDFTDFSKFVAPAALVTENRELLAIAVDDGGTQIYAFVEPIDVAGSGSGTNETEPEEAESGDEEDSVAPTRAGKEDDSETVSGNIGKKKTDNENTKLIVAGIVIVLAVVIFIFRKKKQQKKPDPVGPNINPGLKKEEFPVTKPVTPEYPVTKPVEPEYPVTKPVEKPDRNGWVDVTTDDDCTGLFAVGVAGALQNREFPISERGILIGRGENMDVRYPPDTKGVSRQHCKVFWKDGVLMLMDMGSTSGTLLRGKGQLPANVPVAVVEGDIFYLGSKENALTIRLK